MKKILIILGVVFVAAAIWAGIFYYRNLRGSKPAFGPIPTITEKTTSAPGASVNTTGLPLTLPQGFAISIFAKNVPDARVLVWDPKGRLLVSSPETGNVFALDRDGLRSTVIGGLNKPHGIAFNNGKLYIAETDAVAVYDYDQATGRAANRKKIIDLPAGGNHFSRTIAFGPDGKLYIAIGSSCNACVEKDARRATIQVANADGSNVQTFASGLRNAVFFTWSPFDNKMWATTMGRDLLGDNTPPETVNIISAGKNFGWPYCYGNRIWDKSFDGSKKAEDFCKTVEPPHIEYQAHSAPLGLAFIPTSWGVEYGQDLLVAFHGSWNRSVPTGYNIVRFKLDAKGKYMSAEDFISGWLTSDGALGRPVDLLFDSSGNLFVSDDKAGVIYRVSRT